MIDSRRLLADLQKLLKALEQDIRERVEERPALDAQLKADWQVARDAKRTAATYFEWRDEAITQAGVHWILACVFLRFLEDNGYLDRPFLFGADAATQALARDRHESYFRAHPAHSDREYLVACFTDAAQLPGLAGLYDPRHNPLFRLGVSGDGAMALLAFWRRIDPDRGVVVHDFADPGRATRFLGDLYQDLSESARKRYALLQTPEFVEEFILHRTLTPAIETFGYREVRLIDPTCGSGHFLLGAFARIFALWARNEPSRNAPHLAQRALDSVHGVDLNPFAVETARFRLLIAALTSCGIDKLRSAPDFRINVATGDSLLHGRRFGQLDLGGEVEQLGSRYGHAYATEDLDDVNRILGRQYHAVVGNPPYITPKDAALNEIYRARYKTCHMKYSLGVPFTERFVELAVAGNGSAPAGFVGMITTNSFMKREFGRKLIEEFLPTIDLTHIIDTSGAFIPGHGTPTVILLGRHRGPVANVVRTVMGIKGEPVAPDNPAEGRVWRAILDQVDRAGSESEFMSVADTTRVTFATHPWSVGGGGAAELRERIEDGRQRLANLAESVGITSFTLEDEAFIRSLGVFSRMRVEPSLLRPMVVGDEVRDWRLAKGDMALFAYDTRYAPVDLAKYPHAWKCMWPYRSNLANNVLFGQKTKSDAGFKWWEFGRLTHSKLRTPLTITFAEIATHNHFVLDRGGRVFKNSAPVIKLASDASEDKHLGLLGLLNSSVACFWFQQVCHNKGRPGANIAGADERYEFRYVHDSSKVSQFPLASPPPIAIAGQLDALASQLSETRPDVLFPRGVPGLSSLDASKQRFASIRRQMVALQEELDWQCYWLYNLVEERIECSDPPQIAIGERAFEIVLARHVADGSEQTTWFERHGSTPITTLPAHWPDDYRAVVEQRIAVIESNRSIALVERPEFKRRWNDEPWEVQEHGALRQWLVDRLESERYWPRVATPAMRSTNQLADLARTDPDFLPVAALYARRDDFDVAKLVADLVEAEAVPYLPALRYADEGARKRAAWEHTWALQRQEDSIDARIAAETEKKAEESDEDYACRLAAAQRAARKTDLGEVPVPPKYKSSDFQNTTCWRLRGSLDVPKERFVSYPGASRDADGSLMVAWAGFDHLQQATALAAHYLDLKEQEGWPPERLVPLLAGLSELVPWLRQWHNEVDSLHHERMGDYFAGFVQDEARELGTTVEALADWQPAAQTKRLGGRRPAG